MHMANAREGWWRGSTEAGGGIVRPRPSEAAIAVPGRPAGRARRIDQTEPPVCRLRATRLVECPDWRRVAGQLRRSVSSAAAPHVAETCCGVPGCQPRSMADLSASIVNFSLRSAVWRPANDDKRSLRK